MKRYLVYGILWAVLICGAWGCGKKDSSEQPQKEEQKAEEIVIEEQGDSAQQQAEETPAEVTEPVVLEELSQQIQTFTAAEQEKGALASVYVEELSGGAYASVSPQQMQSASLIKLYVAGCVYENMEVLKAQENYEGETEELLRVMISASDNDAANTLTTRLGSGDAAAGMAMVNQFCQMHGYAQTYMGRLMLDFAATEDNYTSAEDCGRILRDIYNQQLAGSESILAYMKQQERRSKIPAGVPEGVETANKTGELTDVENDAAIIYTDRGAYVLCVMMSDLPDAASGRSVITGLSAAVYQYMVDYLQ